MESLARIGGGAYAVVAILIGLRLLLLARRSRGLPELLIGASLLCLAGIGYPLSAVAREVAGLDASTRAGLGATAGLLGMLGVFTNTCFTWVLFRRGVAWATALVGAVGAGAACLYLAQSLAGGWARGETFWGWLPILITVSYAWASVECGRYFALMRRRVRVGLADPVVANRFLLYTTATALAVSINLVGWVYWRMRLEMLTDPTGGAILFAFGTLSSVLMLLAFVPPRSYIAHVRARARAGA